jgi:predicted ATPase with chaperone activity
MYLNSGPCAVNDILRTPLRDMKWNIAKNDCSVFCVPVSVTKYQKRISGLLLARIDLHIKVLRVHHEN